MVALDEQFHHRAAKARSRRRKDGFGRLGKSPTASVNSVACNNTNGGVTGNIPNGTTDYIWQGWQTVEERNPFGGSGSTDTPIKQYIWGTYIDECIQLNLLVAAGPQSVPVGAYYLLQDLLYRAVALTNSSGQIVEAYDCEAYGNSLIFTAPDTSGNWWGDAAVQSDYGVNETIYCGYRLDPETQLYYVRNRTYNPVLGRWIQRDPIGYAGGINLYGYVESSPAGLVDPSGRVTSGDVQVTLKYLGVLSEKAKKGSEALEHINEAITVVRALRGSQEARLDVMSEALDKLREAAEESIRSAGDNGGGLASAELDADIGEIRVAVALASVTGAMANKKAACLACWSSSINQGSNSFWVPQPPIHQRLYVRGFDNMSNFLGANFFHFSALAKWTVNCKSVKCQVYALIGLPSGNGLTFQWVRCNTAG